MGNRPGDASELSRRRSSGSAVQEPSGYALGLPVSDAMRSRGGGTSCEDVAFEGARAQLTRCLESASKLPWVEAKECHWLRSRVAEKTFTILFLGQSRQGTAAVINALLGERVLPSPLLTTRATVNVLRYGPTPSAWLESSDRSRLVTPMSEREALMHNATRARRIILERPSPWLAGGVALFHMPPVGSLLPYNWHVVHRYLASVDAIVFVSSAWRPLSRLERDFLGDLGPYTEKVLFVLDEPAISRPCDERSAVARAKRMGLAVDRRTPLFAVSASRALASKLDGRIGLPPDPGFAAFERELRDFLHARRSDAWLQPFCRSLSRILSHAQAKLNLERSALTASEEQIARWHEAFELGKARLRGALRGAEESLRKGCAAILKGEVGAGIESFADRERRRIRAVTARGMASEEKLRSMVRATYAAWFLREERTVSRAFDSLGALFWGEMQGAIDAFVREASDLYAGGSPEEGIADVTEFGLRYRFWPHPATVRLRWVLCDPSFPRVVGGALRSTPVTSSALAQIQVHTRRIRAYFAWRTGESVEDLCAYAKGRVASVTEGIEGALRSAAQLRGNAPERGAARQAELAYAVASLSHLEERVRTISAAALTCVGTLRSGAICRDRPVEH